MPRIGHLAVGVLAVGVVLRRGSELVSQLERTKCKLREKRLASFRDAVADFRSEFQPDAPD